MSAYAAKKFFWKMLFGGALFVALLLFLGRTARADLSLDVPDRTLGAEDEPVLEDFDPPVTDTQQLFPPVEWSFFGGTDYNIDSTQQLLQWGGGQQNSATRPRIDINFAQPSPTPDSTVTVIATPANFQTLYLGMYFNWCLGTEASQEGRPGLMISQNGVVAGGRRLPIPEPFRNDCMMMVDRPVATDGDSDIDEDGMGDRWERRYGLNVGVKDGDADIDQDGYTINNNNGFRSLFGMVKVVPDSTAGRTGDGVFTNREEYIWGTSPIDADTDDDGFLDEQDVSGLGQVNFNYQPPKGAKPGQKEIVEVIAVGASTIADPESNGARKLVKIANAAHELVVGSGDALKATVDYKIAEERQVGDKRPPRTDIYPIDTVEFTATVENTVVRAANLHYRWKMRLLDGGVGVGGDPEAVVTGGDPVQFPEHYGLVDARIDRNGYGYNPVRIDLSGRSQDPEVLKFPSTVTPRTGNILELTIEAIEPDTGKTVTTTQRYPISNSFTIVRTLDGEDFGSAPAAVFNPCSPTGRDIAVRDATICVDSASASIITTRVLGLESENEDKVLFEWYLDGTKIPNSKVGAAGNIMRFYANKRTGEYKVSVRMYRVVDQSELAQVVEKIPVVDAPTQITGCPASDQSFPEGTLLTLGATKSQSGTIKAPYAVQYRWTINNAQQPYLDEPTSLTFALPSVGSNTITLETAVFLTGQINSTGRVCSANDPDASCVQPIPTSSTSCTIVATEAGPVASLVNRSNQLLASLPQLVPHVWRQVTAAVLLLGGVAALIIYMSLGTRRKGVKGKP